LPNWDFRGVFCKEKNKKRMTKIKVQKTIKRIKHNSKDVWSHWYTIFVSVIQQTD
jgi:hypothetical protein